MCYHLFFHIYIYYIYIYIYIYMYIIRNGKETRKRGKKRPGYIMILLYIVVQDV